MFVSGYFFNANKNPRNYVGNKVKALIVPAICATPFIFIADCCNKGIFDIHQFFSLLKGDLWFLKCLFICSICTYSIVFICNKQKLTIGGGKILIFIVLFLMLQIIGYYKPGILFNAQHLYLFFILGYFFRNSCAERLVLKHKRVSFLGSVILLGISFHYWDYECYMYNSQPMDVLRATLRLMAGCAGILLTISLVHSLKKFNMFGNLGQYTLGIYIVQTVVFQFYGRKELGLNEYLYDWIFVPITSVCILLISYIIVLLLSKFKITRHYLLGNWK
ncbi:acyltransferase family protein [Phocaeicola intestinalis]|uniref:acyltransferase family protein n=1 Tax=Phocaeicola intestinalis TaxID=2762212 RepID=UPI0037444E06